MNPFWMVYVENRGGPSCRHETPEDACGEARRLCVKTGARAYVLKPVMAFQPTEPPIETIVFD
jgi:hypothetical protein